MSYTYRLKNAGNGFLVSDGDYDLCDVYMTNDPKIAENRARLIAAAPDLLEACKAARSFIRDLETKHDDFSAPLLALDNAIAKAQGK